MRCAAYAGAVNGGYINSQRFSPSFQADKISYIQGWDIDERGSDPNAAMKSQRDYGYLPITLEMDPEKDTRAKGYHVAGYVKVDGPLDLFDDIRSALFQAYNPKTESGACVQAFGTWYHEWTNAAFIPNEYTSFAGYHSYLFVDFTTLNGKDFLIAQNSYGHNVGSNGFHYFPREVVNREFARQGTSLKIVKPLTKEQIELAKQDTFLGRIQKLIISIWGVLSDTYGNIKRA